MHHTNRAKHFLVIIFIIVYTNIGLSQDEKEEKYPRGAQYFLGLGDELLIKVNIWGFVYKPGQYMVPSDTDLISLISYAGGPSKGARLSDIKIVHTEDKNKELDNITEVNVKKYLKNGDMSLIPQLQPGDTIIISGTKSHYVGSFLEFTTKIAILVQVIGWVVYYSNR